MTTESHPFSCEILASVCMYIHTYIVNINPLQGNMIKRLRKIQPGVENFAIDTHPLRVSMFIPNC